MPDVILCQMENRVFFIPEFRGKGDASNINQPRTRQHGGCMAKKNDMADAPVKSEIPLIDEALLKSRIYTVRGVKVMLDADLAEIYGYTTKAFNQQVKNNIEKFDDDFRFQLTRTEYRENLGSKFLTLEQGKYSKTSPYVFTEQGIYMLMTVLKGERATAQSKALIRLFKQMKDCIVENQQLIGVDELPKELLESIVGHIEFMSQRQDQAAANREAT